MMGAGLCHGPTISRKGIRMSISKVSKELLENGLEVIYNEAITVGDLSKYLEVSPSSATTIIRDLLALNCISKGKIKYFKKDGEVSFRDGYFYEQDIPLEYKTAKRRQRKR
jgi:predicted transcriptional regulator